MKKLTWKTKAAMICAMLPENVWQIFCAICWMLMARRHCRIPRMMIRLHHPITPNPQNDLHDDYAWRWWSAARLLSLVCTFATLAGSPMINANSVKVRHGSSLDRLLILAEEHVGSDVWQRLIEKRDAFLELAQQIKNISQKDHHEVIQESMHQRLPTPVNAWGSLDQTNAFYPDLPPLTYWNGVPANTPMPDGLAGAIPNRYRLAEAMGIGTNSVHIEVSAEDGELFANVEAGYHIGQRIRHSLIGQFWVKGENLPVRVFQHSILSRGRLNTQDILLGPEVKPHQFKLKRRPVEALYRTGLGERIWKEERLDLRFPEGFDEVLQSPEQAKLQQALELRVEHSIQQRLKAWRQKRIDFQWGQLKSMDIPDRLDALYLGLVEWEAVHTDGATCTLSSHAKTLINAEQLHQRIHAQVQDAHPWMLEQAEMKRMESVFNASVAHGLYHRVPESARESVLLCWLNILKEALWTE